MDTSNYVVILNGARTQKDITISINGRSFFSSFDDIVKRAISVAASGEDSIRAIWEFTARHSYHYYPMTAYVWLHNPLVFLNSAGFGFCDDVAKVNEILWKACGYDARTWFLNGHVVSEVFQGGKWKMLDSDLGCYFLTEKGQIASVEELFESPFYVVNNRIPSRHRDMRFTEEDWQLVRLLYEKKEGYVDVTSFDSLEHVKPMKFILPPKSKLIMGDKIARGFRTDLIENGHHLVPDYANLLLVVQSASNQLIELPLIVQQVKGDGTVVIDGQEYAIGGAELDQLLLRRPTYINSLFVKSAKNLKVAMLFNRRLFYVSSQDTINISGEDLRKIKVRRLKRIAL